MSGIAQCLNGPVKEGDLVRVVMPSLCCGWRGHVGQVFRVMFFDDGEADCTQCGAQMRAVDAIYRIDQRGAWGQPVSCLIRIDPPALPESIDTEREVTA